MTQKTLTPEQLVTLEQLIDRTSLSAVLAGVANICVDKADHLRANWQDEHSAHQWDKAALAVGDCVDRAGVRRVSL